MTLPLRTTSTPPPPLRKIPRGDCADDYSGIEDLDRSELDDAPDTEREEHAPPTNFHRSSGMKKTAKAA